MAIKTSNNNTVLTIKHYLKLFPYPLSVCETMSFSTSRIAFLFVDNGVVLTEFCIAFIIQTLQTAFRCMQTCASNPRNVHFNL